MKNPRAALILIIIAIAFGTPVVAQDALQNQAQAQAQAQEQPSCGVPSNIDMPKDLAKKLLDMYERSSTFRSQCARISEASTLRVTIQYDPTMRSNCRAFTVISRRGHDIRAEMHLPPASASLVELVGHEFEHMLEQLDGWDLRQMAKEKGSGVHQVESELFETDRAQHAGLLVADEFRHPNRSTN